MARRFKSNPELRSLRTVLPRDYRKGHRRTAVAALIEDPRLVTMVPWMLARGSSVAEVAKWHKLTEDAVREIAKWGSMEKPPARLGKPPQRRNASAVPLANPKRLPPLSAWDRDAHGYYFTAKQHTRGGTVTHTYWLKPEGPHWLVRVNYFFPSGKSSNYLPPRTFQSAQAAHAEAATLYSGTTTHRKSEQRYEDALRKQVQKGLPPDWDPIAFLEEGAKERAVSERQQALRARLAAARKR